MSEETVTGQKSLEPLQTGKVPDRRPDRLWGGRGNGKDYCQICGQRLETEDIAFDLEYRGEAGQTACYSVHLRCFNEWDLERQARDRTRARHHETSPAKGPALPDATGTGTMPRSERNTFPTDF